MMHSSLPAGCPCKVEEGQPQAVQEQLQAMFDWLASGDRLERARAVINSKDSAAVAALKQDLQQHVDDLESKMKEHGVVDVSEDA